MALAKGNSLKVHAVVVNLQIMAPQMTKGQYKKDQMSWYSYLDIGHVFAQPRYDGGDNQVVDVAGNHAGDTHHLEAIAAWHQVPWKAPLSFAGFHHSILPLISEKNILPFFGL